MSAARIAAKAVAWMVFAAVGWLVLMLGYSAVRDGHGTVVLVLLLIIAVCLLIAMLVTVHVKGRK